MIGHPGDTLASALLANRVDVVGSSVQLGRPRGIFAAGVEDPNGLVQVSGEGLSEPMAKATTLELFDGLEARSLAGYGRISAPSGRIRAEKRYHHCDVLVIGGGSAGLKAAVAAAIENKRVLLVEEGPDLRACPAGAEGETASRAAAFLADSPDVRVLTRATAIALFEHGFAVVRERRPGSTGCIASECLWHVRATEIVLATGAIERPFVFSGNDRPGIMLLGGATSFANEFGVISGKRGVVFAGHDDAYSAAIDLLSGGVELELMVDTRPEARAEDVARLRDRGVEVLTRSAVVSTSGEERLETIAIARLDDNGLPAGILREVPCDLLAVSAGWVPNLQLYGQAGGRLRYDPSIAAHVPATGPSNIQVTGRANGDGVPKVRATWSIPPVGAEHWDEHFVDLQRDATVADVQRAVDAGLRSPEHIKRYTTIGTGEDQGKTSGLNALGIIAQLLDVPIDELQPTVQRPPYSTLPFAAMAGRARGALHDPIRTTTIHQWHVREGAVFENVGQWKRPRCYPDRGEGIEEATLRETAAVRRSAGIMDASTLGKIDVQGPDAAKFLDRLYTNGISSLPVNMCRYGLMCEADGMVFDDGVVMRLAENHFVVTTTTGGAAAVLDWMEKWLQTEWSDLRVRLTSVTDHWATIAIAGPSARAVLDRLEPGIPIDAGSFPFMAIRECSIGEIPVRICRVSFSGELAFEIHVAARYGLGIWESAIEAGRDVGLTPYGTEALHVLRAEKGYVIVGQDTDGTATPQDLGMGWAISKKKDFFIGRRSHRRADTARSDRRQFVGLLPDDPDSLIPEGAQLFPADEDRQGTAGHVTSSYRSPALGRSFALGLLSGGHERYGEKVRAVVDDVEYTLEVTGTVFYDPENDRRDGRPA